LVLRGTSAKYAVLLLFSCPASGDSGVQKALAIEVMGLAVGLHLHLGGAQEVCKSLVGAQELKKNNSADFSTGVS